MGSISRKKIKIILLSFFAVLVVFLIVILISKYKADSFDPTPKITLPVTNERFYYANNPMIQGKAWPGHSITILVDNNSIGQTTVEPDGNYYFKPDTALSEDNHSIVVKDTNNTLSSNQVNIEINTSNPTSAILKANGTQIYEKDHPFYANGVNDYRTIVNMMGNPTEVENSFKDAEKRGIKMLRVINYMQDDMELPNPAEAPIATVSSGTGSLSGDYIYRYTCANLSKTNFAYDTAETLPSPISQTVTVTNGQKVNLILKPCAQSYKYSIYRRLSTDAVDSELLIDEISQAVGVNATYVDDGSKTPSRGMPTTNQTQDNPRTKWPTQQSKAYMTGSGNWNEDALVASDKVMVLAKKYNIRIMFTFFDQHDNNTGGIPEIARNCGVSRSAFFTDTCSKNMARTVIDKFTNRTNSISGVSYKNDPSIFAWELTNEAFDTGSGTAFRNWIWEIGSYLKSNDNNHMLSSGDDGSIWFTHNYEAGPNGNNNHDFVTMGTPSPIDLLTWHGYPEGAGFVFSHGYYGEFDPTNPAKRAGLSDAEATAWIDLYGPVKGPISIPEAVKQLKLHEDYAVLLNKPVVFGEWGVDYKDSNQPTSKNWIEGLSDAVLTARPNLEKIQNITTNALSSPFSDFWDIDSNSPALSLDSSEKYNNNPSLKIETKLGSSEYRNYIVSKEITVKPNTKYWFEFSGKSIDPTNDDTLWIAIFNWYKGDIKETPVNSRTGLEEKIHPTNYDNGWKTMTRFNDGLAEFTTPADVDGLELLVAVSKGNYAYLGDINIYELGFNPNSDTTTFSTTGWWPNTGLDSATNLEAFKTAAINFANRSVRDLPPVPSTVTTTPPAAPSNVTVDTITTTGLTVHWTDNSNGEASFKIYVSDTANNNCDIASYPANPSVLSDAGTTSRAITGLTQNTDYCVKVNSSNTAGDSSFAFSSEVKTLLAAVTIPSPPSNITIDAITTDDFTVHWDDNSNDETSFKIYVSTNTVGGTCNNGENYPANPSVSSDAGTNSKSISGLSQNTDYCVKMASSNSAGDSSAVFSSKVKTLLVPSITLPTISAQITKSTTYKDKCHVSGTKSTDVTVININEVDRPASQGSNSFEYDLDIPIGTTNITIFGKDSNNTSSAPVALSIVRKKIGDANSDNSINIYDFSALMSNWNKTNSQNVADFNEDGVVNIYDFSAMMSSWGK